MNQNISTLYPFLKAARGNWHNALFVKCTHNTCPYGHPAVCSGFLFVADADGTPLLVDIEAVQRMAQEAIEPESCHGILTQRSFASAYASYLEWHTEDGSQCPLRLLCQTYGCSC